MRNPEQDNNVAKPGTPLANGTNSLLDQQKAKKGEPDATAVAEQDPGGILRVDSVCTDLLEVWFSGSHTGEQTFAIGQKSYQRKPSIS
jgi:hypothetical protein